MNRPGREKSSSFILVHGFIPIFRQIADPEELESIVEDSSAIEDAIVGDIVYVPLPDFVNEYMSNLPYSLIVEDMSQKNELDMKPKPSFSG